MKNQESNDPKTLLEELWYEKNGIEVDVRIDYRKKKISVIDRNGEKKNFLFAEREVEYMDGWKNILEAIIYATQEAKKRLQERIEEEQERVMELIADADKFGE